MYKAYHPAKGKLTTTMDAWMLENCHEIVCHGQPSRPISSNYVPLTPIVVPQTMLALRGSYGVGKEAAMNPSLIRRAAGQHFSL